MGGHTEKRTKRGEIKVDQAEREATEQTQISEKSGKTRGQENRFDFTAHYGADERGAGGQRQK